MCGPQLVAGLELLELHCVKALEAEELDIEIWVFPKIMLPPNHPF